MLFQINYGKSNFTNIRKLEIKYLGQKKKVLFPETARIVECVSEYTFIISKK